MKQLCIVLVAAALLGIWGCKSDIVEPKERPPVQDVVTDACTNEPIPGVMVRMEIDNFLDSMWTDDKGRIPWPRSVRSGVHVFELTKSGYSGCIRRITYYYYCDSHTVDAPLLLYPLNACLTGTVVEDLLPPRDTMTLDFSRETGIFPVLYETTVDSNGHFRFDSLPATPSVLVKNGAWVWEGSSLVPVDTLISLRYNNCVDVTLCPPTGPSDFPSTIGMWWQYRVSHTLEGAFDDTVTVSIVDSTRMSDGRKAMIWVEQHGAAIETSFVANDHDTIKVCESRDYGYPKAMYPSRFRVGYFRRGLDCGDTTRIADSQLVSVPYSPSVMTYRLHRTWNCIDNAGDVSVWLARGLGVVKSQESRITFIGLSVERRELSSFHAPD